MTTPTPHPEVQVWVDELAQAEASGYLRGLKDAAEIARGEEKAREMSYDPWAPSGAWDAGGQEAAQAIAEAIESRMSEAKEK